MQSSVNLEPRESIKSLQDYLSQNNYRNLLVFSLIFMFSIVFYLIYLIVDSTIDKVKHYNLSLQAYEKYETSKQQQTKSTTTIQDDLVELQDAKEKLAERNRKIDFTVWSNRNLQISFIHSCLCSAWLIRILYARNAELFSDLLFHIDWDSYLLLAFSCGYFLYDFYDIYTSGYFKKEWVVCLHHWIVLVSFSYHMINLLSVGYTVIALLMEFNSVFLHARKLLKFYGFKSNSTMAKLNSFFNLLTFVIFRFGVLMAIFYSIKIDGHRVTMKYLIMLITCLVLMAIINIVLFKRLIFKDVLPIIVNNNKNKGQSINLNCNNNNNNSTNLNLKTYVNLALNTMDTEQTECLLDNNNQQHQDNNNNLNDNLVTKKQD